MDGVFADFDGYYRKIFGTSPDYPETVIDWNYMNKMYPSWFLILPMLKDSELLFRHIKKYNPIILTACPPQMRRGPTEKKLWVYKHLGLPKEKTIVVSRRQEKIQYAVDSSGVPNILIDDKEDTINKWNQAGGIGIMHYSINKTIKELQELGL